MCPPDFDPHASPPEQRRAQILNASMLCFARRGFHQTTMQDISHEAGISVGLIYRYFESKDHVIGAMATEHVGRMQQKLEAARQLPTLVEALEAVLWCDEHGADVTASFVVDLFAESARNEHVRKLVTRVHGTVLGGVTELIASSPEAAHLAPSVTPALAAEVVFQAIHGHMFDELLHGGGQEAIKASRTAMLRRLWSLLFTGAAASRPASAD